MRRTARATFFPSEYFTLFRRRLRDGLGWDIGIALYCHSFSPLVSVDVNFARAWPPRPRVQTRRRQEGGLTEGGPAGPALLRPALSRPRVGRFRPVLARGPRAPRHGSVGKARKKWQELAKRVEGLQVPALRRCHLALPSRNNGTWSGGPDQGQGRLSAISLGSPSREVCLRPRWTLASANSPRSQHKELVCDR